MNKIYIIRRMNVLKDTQSYMKMDNNNCITWGFNIHLCKIFGAVEDAFVVLNKLIGHGINECDYCVMEIIINETRVELITKPVKKHTFGDHSEEQPITIIQEWFETTDVKRYFGLDV